MHLPKSIINQIMHDIQEELEEEENEFQEMEEEEEETVEMMEYFASIEDYAQEVVPSPTPSPLPEGECWIPDPKDVSPCHSTLACFRGTPTTLIGVRVKVSVICILICVAMYRD